MTWDLEIDFLIAGSGAGSILTALRLKDEGFDSLILESTDMFGGSTAMSGGVIWVPDNPVMKRAGVKDSYEEARAYLDACVGDVGPASSPERRDAFLRAGPEMVEYLETKGMRFVHPEGYSDYHEGELPGEIGRAHV